jgi:hypothetical protein
MELKGLMPFPGGPVVRTVGLEEITLVCIRSLFYPFFLLDLGDGSVESKMVPKLTFLIKYVLCFCVLQSKI